MIKGTTEQLSEFIVHTSFKDMPEEAVARAKIMFIDTIGVALAGTAIGEAGKIAIKYAKDIGGVPEATVIAGGFQTSAPNVAFTNALLSHAVDFDDWELSGHPSSMLVATSLSLGEKMGLAGRSLLESYILGLEVYDKIACGCPDARARGWHGTAVYGTMGATSAAAKLLGLGVNETIMALGIAASAASGISRQRGTMTKPYQVGRAARNGVEAALLAKDGFTADEAIIENPMGFCDIYLGAGACDYDKMTRNMGKPFHIVSPGLGLKPYPCRFPEFRAIDAVLDLRREHAFEYKDVDQAEIGTTSDMYKVTILDPKTGLQGKFSTNYVCAIALLDGKLSLASFTDEKVRDPIVQEALGKVKLVAEKTIPNEWADAWSRPVTIKLKDGRTLSKRVDIPRGDPRNPLSINDVLAKYRDNASLVLPSQQVEHSINLLQNLDQAKDVTELMDILRQPATGSV